MSNSTRFVSHVFVAQTTPTERQIHCLHAHQSEKKFIESKIIRNGRVIHIICEENAITPKTVVLEENTFTFKRTEAAMPFNAKAKDFVTISTRLCYVVNRRIDGKSFTETPVNPMGKIKPHLKKQFIEYLEKATGLEGFTSKEGEFIINREDAHGEEDRNRKVWFNGVINLSLRGRVKDAEVFNRLAYQSIGNRRSYGFGGVSCDLVEPFEDENQIESEELATA